MKRRKFIEHVSWTGLGIVWAVGENGLLTACQVGTSKTQPASTTTPFSFVQISDTHIGFHKPANEHVTDTLQKTIAAINALPVQPAFVVHTGDISHLSKPAEFDQAKQLLSQLKVPLFTLPGEHDTIGDRGKAYEEAFPRKAVKEGLQVWDQGGIHFVAVTNVLDFGATGKGELGQAQLDLLTQDLLAQKSDTPIVVFSHIPLYDLYPKWGWATADSAKLLSLLSRFASVTVLSGHIHQVIQHSEGNIRFHTAAATAYPLPAPGKGEQPAPVKLPENHLLAVLGFRTVEVITHQDTQIEQHSLG
ncbi:MAG: metallophosphoesterase [Scytolyngbya sp. HA4215-MV1]|jgi:3',5'-cyclic AMP phosphodiesterase CpdA|nr:metallophosphoesterase [Scytolyngbya sp. HA4215-MV1]